MENDNTELKEPIRWTCPDCGNHNTDYTPSPTDFLCEHCNKWFDPDDIKTNGSEPEPVVGPPEPTRQQKKLAVLLKTYRAESLAVELQVSVATVYRWLRGEGITKTHLRKLMQLR